MPSTPREFLTIWLGALVVSSVLLVLVMSVQRLARSLRSVRVRPQAAPTDWADGARQQVDPAAQRLSA